MARYEKGGHGLIESTVWHQHGKDDETTKNCTACNHSLKYF
jgi:hypothetical protein